MAIIQPTYELVGGNVIVMWDGLAAGDVGAAIDVSGFNYRVAQFIGALSGSTFSVYGSNDNTTFVLSGASQLGSGSGEYHEFSGNFRGRYAQPRVDGGSASGVKVILVMRA